jgi:hypothetical protein
MEIAVSTTSGSTPGSLLSVYKFDADDIPKAEGLTFDQNGRMMLAVQRTVGPHGDDFNLYDPTKPIQNNPPTVAFVQGSLINLHDNNGDGFELVTVDPSLTKDDGRITQSQWFIDGAPQPQTPWRWGEVLRSSLPIGSHQVILRVTDDAFATASSSITVNIVSGPQSDTFPQPDNSPTLSLNYIHPGSLVQQAEFEFELMDDGSAMITIFDSLGREVKKIETDFFPKGKYRQPWNLTNKNGEAVASGVYFASIKTASGSRREKVVVVR